MSNINQVQLPDGSQYNITDTTSGYATQSDVQSAISGITKTTIGLGNVDNTSDANKPVSAAQQTALDSKTNTSMVAYVESSTTATKRYEIGDQFILNGALYTATAIIANGGTITVGTNCTASDTIIEQIPNIDGKADKTDLTSISETGSTASQAISAGTYFYLDGVLVRAKTDIASGATFTENTNYEVVSVGGLNSIGNILKGIFPNPDKLIFRCVANGNVSFNSQGIAEVPSGRGDWKWYAAIFNAKSSAYINYQFPTSVYSNMVGIYNASLVNQTIQAVVLVIGEIN